MRKATTLCALVASTSALAVGCGYGYGFGGPLPPPIPPRLSMPRTARTNAFAEYRRGEINVEDEDDEEVTTIRNTPWGSMAGRKLKKTAELRVAIWDNAAIKLIWDLNRDYKADNINETSQNSKSSGLTRENQPELFEHADDILAYYHTAINGNKHKISPSKFKRLEEKADELSKKWYEKKFGRIEYPTTIPPTPRNQTGTYSLTPKTLENLEAKKNENALENQPETQPQLSLPEYNQPQKPNQSQKSNYQNQPDLQSPQARDLGISVNWPLLGFSAALLAGAYYFLIRRPKKS